MRIVYLISLTTFLIGLSLLFIGYNLNKKKRRKLVPKKNCNFAILIPARNESKVIKNLLDSIKTQVKDFSSTYIIVEDKLDKTCQIAKDYKANVIVRKNIDNKKTKGYALDEALKTILKKDKYDLYFIFDADNILDENFIESMLDCYQKGYKIATGYRNIKNASNACSICSGLMFSFVNNLINKNINKTKNANIISGTGYYISGDIINSLEGFPFYSLTEDYELTLYASVNKIPTFYNENAIFYDEQPTSIKESIKQRTRWVKGFFDCQNSNIKNIKDDYQKMLGILPYILIISGITIFIFSNIFESIYFLILQDKLYIYTFSIAIITILLVYFSISIVTIFIIQKEKKYFNINTRDKIKAIFFNPIFIFLFVICFIKAMINRKLEWEPIEHKENEVIKKAK